MFLKLLVFNGFLPLLQLSPPQLPNGYPWKNVVILLMCHLVSQNEGPNRPQPQSIDLSLSQSFADAINAADATGAPPCIASPWFVASP